MFFGTKSHYTILSNYVTIFKVDAEMSEIFTDFSREKSQKNSAHWLQWVRNYWYLCFTLRLVMFLQGALLKPPQPITGWGHEGVKGSCDMYPLHVYCLIMHRSRWGQGWCGTWVMGCNSGCHSILGFKVLLCKLPFVVDQSTTLRQSGQVSSR